MDGEEAMQTVGQEYMAYVRAMRRALFSLGQDEKVAEALIASLVDAGFIWEKTK